MRAFSTALILSLIFAGCFGSRSSGDETGYNNTGGYDEGPDSVGSTGGRGVPPTVSRDRDGGSSSGYCGDGIIQYSSGEQCDRYNLGGESCASLFNHSQDGELSCNRDCTFNANMCYQSVSEMDAGRWDSGWIIRDAGRNGKTIIDLDDAGEDDGERSAVSGNCVRSTGAACDRDIDCRVGGCGGEICYNPDLLDVGNTPCDGCETPRRMSCGCVNGGCTWWD